ncbi:sulfite oxidase, partial [Streptomyces solincola]
MSRSSSSESVYDHHRRGQWARGEARADGVARRDLMKLAAAAGTALPLAATASPPSAAAAAGIVKPLPPELFTLRGTNAETRFPALRGTGHHTPADRFFVRNHTTTPRIKARDWRLTMWGGGLSAGPLTLTYDHLRALPARTLTACIECAGNGRSFYTTQQGQDVSGTAWTLGAIGVGRWRGVRLADVLKLAGITRRAVDVMPRGLDDEVVVAGANLGRVRRPLPVAKALDDALLAYEMNGEELPPDHGFPVRLVVPGWIGVSSVKWLGDIEVADVPLYSPWNTDLYRLFGPGHPEGGSAPLTRQTIKSAFELEWAATLPARRPTLLTGRSWSGAAPVRTVEVSTDGGARW